METTHDLLKLLNKIKMDELGDKGHPFIMPHLNYFIDPARNKKSYKNFRIPKKTGGFRVISAPKALLKSFLTYTNKLLQAYYNAPEYVTGFAPGKSVVDNAERHIGKNYVFNTDLKDFFPSISKSRVWATLKHAPFKFNDTIADAIAGLCCTIVELEGKKVRALPQGSPCSPTLTNIVCRILDHKLHELAKKYNVRYSRYADDITFSSNHNVYQDGSEFRKELKEIIEGQNFTINDKKTRLQKKNQRQEVTGLVVSDRVNVTRQYVRELDNLLYIWEHHGESDANAKFLGHYAPKHNLHKGYPGMRAVIQGKLLYLKMVKGTDSEVWRRLQRRFNKLAGQGFASEIETVKYRYSIADFEKKLGSSLLFKYSSNDTLICSFMVGAKSTYVALSKYARTRLSNILNSGDEKKMERFKSTYVLILYVKDDTEFWRIERKRNWVGELTDSTIVFATETDASSSSASDVSATSETPQKTNSDSNTDKVLSELISSGFDLNTLDLWDKTSNS